jgi:hypothetical protein
VKNTVKSKSKKTDPVPDAKKAEPFVVKGDITVKEIPDASGEVKETTIIQVSLEGILVSMSVGAAMRLQRKLSEVLDN